MTTKKIKEMLDACYHAKRIMELLPKLPDGVSSAYIRYIDTIHMLLKNKENVKISDISEALKLPRPGITRTVNEMVSKGYLRKYSSVEDGRITYIAITKKGEELSEKYDKNYYECLCKHLEDISEEDADCMIETIEKFYKVMSERRVDIE